jgi:hypothetical protein
VVKSQFLNVRQAARWLGLAVKTLESWRGAGSGPAFHRFGRALRYRRSDLENFAAKAKHTCPPSDSPTDARKCAADREAKGRNQ